MTRTLLISAAIAALILTAGCAGRYDVQPEDMFAHMPDPVEMPKPTSGAIYAAGASRSLFEDPRAQHVGDILIVQLAEQTSAEKNSDTSVSKANETSITNPVLAGSERTFQNTSTLGFDLDSNHAFSGSSDSSQSNRLSGTIAVTVRDVLPDGTLIIGGEKWVKLNRGNEYVRITGMVRPRDIRQDNSVLSTYVANARIAYSGTGETADANVMGWLSRFFLSPVWPF